MPRLGSSIGCTSFFEDRLINSIDHKTRNADKITKHMYEVEVDVHGSKTVVRASHHTRRRIVKHAK